MWKQRIPRISFMQSHTLKISENAMTDVVEFIYGKNFDKMITVTLWRPSVRYSKNDKEVRYPYGIFSDE